MISNDQKVSAIVPTLGRPPLLHQCLTSLSKQSVPVSEVVVVHCGDDAETQEVANDDRWVNAGMHVRYFHYAERNCAAQRNFAIEKASYNNLLLIDDDVEADERWVEELLKPIWSDSSVGATMGNIINQQLSSPTPFWKFYRVLLYGKEAGMTPGRLVGAALPNGFPKSATEPIPCEWIGGGASAVRRDAFLSVGGFAPFFTGSSPGEDLDLGYRLSRRWKVYYVPSATCIHHQSPERREQTDQHQYLSMRSRFGILTSTMSKGRPAALAHIALWAMVQGLSEIAALRKGSISSDLLKLWKGRTKGFISCLTWHPERVGQS